MTGDTEHTESGTAPPAGHVPVDRPVGRPVPEREGLSMLDIKDKPGAISKKLMRHYFEGAINNTAVLKANTPLGAVTMNGEFRHYADGDTDTMWIGFALGMRCGERLQAAIDAQTAGVSLVLKQRK